MSKPPGRWQRWIKVVAIIAFFAVGIVVAWPEPPAQLLVAADGWEVEGGFLALDPPVKDLRESARSNPKARYWRSWSPESGSQPGVLRTAPFLADGPFAVPYNGFAGEPGVNAFLECAATGKRSYLATSRNNTQWSEVWVEMPKRFCQGPVRIVATTTSTTNYIALGTPYQLSRLSEFKSSSVVGFWFLLLAGGVIVGWFILFGSLSSRFVSRINPATGGLIGVGLIGYMQFFLFWYLPPTGGWIALALLVLGLVASISALFARNGFLDRRMHSGPIRFAACLWLAVALAYFALSTMVESGAGPWEVNGRFTPARWSSDNQLPAFVSRILVSGNHVDLSDFGPWAIGDRPPLAYGWHATLHSVLVLVGNLGDEQMYFHRYQLATGIVLNTCWVAFLALSLPKLGLSRARTLLAILALSLCPLFIFNSVFIWPKLLSGTFTLAAAWILLGVEPGSRRLRDDNAGLVAAAILSALGLLTHGGSAFGIIVMLAFALLFRGLPSMRGGIIAAATALLLLLPWSLWQSANHASGNALLKFAFAGTFGFGEEHIGVADTILRSYRDLGMDAWLAKKRDGLMSILFGLRNTCGINEMGQAHSAIDSWRASDFYNIFPSLNFLVLGFVSFGIWRPRTAVHSDVKRAAARLLVFGLASIGFSWLITWDCFINHVQSYQALIALHLGLVLALLMSGRWGAVALACSVLYGLVVWVVEPLNHFPRFDPISTIVLASMAILAVHAIRAAHSSDVKQSQ